MAGSAYGHDQLDPRGLEHPDSRPCDEGVRNMAGKNKGGREVRKPKQDKKPKSADSITVIDKVAAGKKPK
jgi:hypothetical protein